jgi:hypothetical protein
LRENPGASPVESSASASSEEQPGFLSPAAADLQRRAALESMYPPGNALPATPLKKSLPVDSLNPVVLLMKGTSGEPFFISWRSQIDVVETLAWRSILYIWGGPILALAGLWLLLDRLLLEP